MGATRAFNSQRQRNKERAQKKNGDCSQKQPQVKMTLIGQNTYLIASVSSPPILTQHQSKPARLRHAESAGILPETCTPVLPLPHGKAKGRGLQHQLWRARNKARTIIQLQCCLTPYIHLGLAECIQHVLTQHDHAQIHGRSCCKCQ